MGSDPIERNRQNGAEKKASKKNAYLGCFVGLNPTKAQKDLVAALVTEYEMFNQLWLAALNSGLIISCRWDERNGASMVTLTRKYERWEDNQTLGAFHIDPLKALGIALVCWRDHYTMLEDWRTATRQLELDW
jgi:hypothetical protein